MQATEEGAEYRERHRERYAVLLGRIVEAYRKPEAVRLEHAALLRRLVVRCRDERIKATSGFMHDETAPIGHDDPLIEATDALLGNVEDIARGIAATTFDHAVTVEEALALIGAEVMV